MDQKTSVVAHRRENENTESELKAKVVQSLT